MLTKIEGNAKVPRALDKPLQIKRIIKVSATNSTEAIEVAVRNLREASEAEGYVVSALEIVSVEEV